MSEHQDPRPRDDAVRDLARDLAEVAAQIATIKGEANAYLGDPSYDALRHRLEMAHAAVEAATVEARRRVRLNAADRVAPHAESRQPPRGDVRLGPVRSGETLRFIVLCPPASADTCPLPVFFDRTVVPLGFRLVLG